MRVVNEVSTVALVLALAALASCSLFRPSTPGEVNEFEYAGYPDSPDRRQCVREADEQLRRTIAPSGDMYDETRKRMRLEFIDECMKKRGH